MLDLLANYAGNFLPKLIYFLVLPILNDRLGTEALGIIGIQVLIVSVMAVFHQSLGRAASRFCAQSGGRDARTVQILFGIEQAFLILAATVAIGCYFGRGWLAHIWIGPTHFPEQTVTASVALIGLMSGFQIAQVFYYNGMLGLGRHKMANAFLGTGEMLRYGGIIPLLLLTPIGLVGVLVWQSAIAGVQSAAMAWAFWRGIPKRPRRTFNMIPALKEVGHFTAGLSFIVVLGILTSQADRIILSAMLPIALFGEYTIVTNLARVIPLLIAPISNVLFPRLSADLTGNQHRLSSDYHVYAQLVAATTIPPSLFLAFFARDVLHIYVGGAAWVPIMAPALTFLVIGMMLAALYEAPYTLQLAAGWTSLHLKLLAGILGPLVIANWMMARLAGAQGVAAVFILLGVGFLAIGIPAMHRKLLQGEAMYWLTRDFVFPLAITIGFCAAGAAVTSTLALPAVRLCCAVPFGIAAMATAFIASPDLRRHGRFLLGRLREV